MTFGARSGSHDDILLSLAIACWRPKVAGDESGMLSYHRNAVERAKQTDLSVGATEVSRPSRWVGSPKQVIIRLLVVCGIRIVRFRLCIDLYNFVAAALAAASSRTPIISSVQGLQ